MSNPRLPRLNRPIFVGGTALLLMNMALSLALWDVWQTPMSWGAVSLSPMQIPQILVEAPPASNDDALVKLVLARPVFEPSRRPFVPPPPAPAVPPPVAAEQSPQPVLDLVVDGILLNGGIRKAHLRKHNEAGGDWQAEGDIIEGWTIAVVADAKVILQRANQRIEIELYPKEQGP